MKFTIEMNIYELSRSIKAGTLERLVNDIKEHETEVRSGKTGIPAPDPQPVAKTPAPEATVVETPEKNTSEITEVQIRAKFVELSRKGKKKELKALLSELGVEKVSDIKPEQYADAWARLEAL